jgi:FtsH-binding integral membrane protein
MNGMVALFGWIANSLAYLTEVSAYAIHALWVTIVRAALALLEVVDDWLPGLDILENALWRFLVMAVVGFFLGVGLMIFLSFIIGAWGIPCAFTLAIGFCAFVGLLADPERDWSFGDYPTFGRHNGPQTPLNL